MSVRKKGIIILIIKILIVTLLPCMAWIDSTFALGVLVFAAYMPWVLIVAALLFVISMGAIFHEVRTGKNFFTRHMVQPIILAGCLILSVVGNYHVFLLNERIETEKYYENKRIESEQIMEFKAQAEEIIPKGNVYFPHGYNYTDIESEVIMIDYDTMRVAFLNDNVLCNYFVVQLTEGEKLPREKIQRTEPLKEPGVELVSFYLEEEHKGLTDALELTMADGRVFTATDIKNEKGKTPSLGLW